MNPKKEKRPPQSQEETANQNLSDSSKSEPSVKPATAHERLDYRLSVFAVAQAANPCSSITLRDLFEHIRNGEYRAEVEKIRSLAGKDPEAAKALKKRLKSVALSGFIKQGIRGQAMQQGRFLHSGLIQIDIDDKELRGAKPEVCRDTLADDPHIVVSFLSPSGQGVKAVMLIPTCTSKEKHKNAYAAASKYVAEEYGWNNDKRVSDPCRLCFVSYDPDARLNGEAIELPRSHFSSRATIYSFDESEKSEKSVVSVSSVSQGGETLLQRINQSEIAEKELKANKRLWKLYRQWIESKYTARQGERNGQTVNMMTFLARAVCESTALRLAKYYWRINQDQFADSLEQHMTEANAQLRNTLGSWLESLPAHERELVAGLPEKQRAAFRICRALASLHKGNSPRGSFFLSHRDLGRRLETSDSQAGRIFRQLEGLQCLKLGDVGEQWTTLPDGQIGNKGVASSYRWQMSMEEGEKGQILDVA